MIPTNLSPGTEIICIDDSPNQRGEETNVVKGEIYTIKGYSLNKDDISVLLNEIEPARTFTLLGQIVVGYYRYRFKLLEKSMKVFDQMLDEISKLSPEELAELEHELEIETCIEELEKVNIE